MGLEYPSQIQSGDRGEPAEFISTGADPEKQYFEDRFAAMLTETGARNCANAWNPAGGPDRAKAEEYLPGKDNLQRARCPPTRSPPRRAPRCFRLFLIQDCYTYTMNQAVDGARIHLKSRCTP